MVTGGERGEGPGRFYRPTVLADVDHSMRCMVEETFGPTLPVMRVRDADEAVELANDGPYGLQASVWTRDHDRGERLARRIEAGTAMVNDAQLNYAALELPMGGWKASGLGSRHGPDGIRKYTKRQSLMVTPGYAPSRDAHHFPYSAQVSAAIGEAFSLLATSELFSDAQRATLIALCDTFIPALEPPAGDEDHHGFWARAASHLSVPEGIEVALLGAGLDEAQTAGLRSLLDSLAESGMSSATLRRLREQIVHGFCDQSPEALAGISTLRGLAGTLFYALPELGTGVNPNWAAIGYPPPAPAPADRERPLRVRRPSGADETVEADVCVVGSGAGGGVIAGELAAAGRSVVVLEAGDYLDDADFDGLEINAYQRSYLAGGPFPTAEGQVSIVAGTGVGGGTVVNWTNCLRTYDHVRAEWASEHGLTDLAESDFDRHLDAVFERLGVNDDCSDLNGPHQRMREGCERLGYDFRLITRNADRDLYSPESAAFMGFGDASGSKRSTAKTYLVDAQEAGAEIFVGAARDQDPGRGRARGRGRGALGRPVAGGGQRRPRGRAHRARARGRRRRRRDPLAGAAAALADRRPRRRRPPAPAPDSGGDRLLRRAPELDVGPAAGGALAPVRRHRRRLRLPDRVRPGDHRPVRRRDPMALGRRPQTAHARVGPRGSVRRRHPRARPRPGRDRRRRQPRWSTIRSADEADRRPCGWRSSSSSACTRPPARREIVGSGMRAPDWTRGDDLEAFIAAAQRARDRAARVRPFSAHQMGSCRMGRDPQTSVANPLGRAPRHARRLDRRRERLPLASGTNPMATIMALARRTAHAIAARRPMEGPSGWGRRGAASPRRRDRARLPGDRRPGRRAVGARHGPRDPDDPLGPRLLRAARRSRASA